MTVAEKVAVSGDTYIGKIEIVPVCCKYNCRLTSDHDTVKALSRSPFSHHAESIDSKTASLYFSVDGDTNSYRKGMDTDSLRYSIERLALSLTMHTRGQTMIRTNIKMFRVSDITENPFTKDSIHLYYGINIHPYANPVTDEILPHSMFDNEFQKYLYRLLCSQFGRSNMDAALNVLRRQYDGDWALLMPESLMHKTVQGVVSRINRGEQVGKVAPVMVIPDWPHNNQPCAPLWVAGD